VSNDEFTPALLGRHAEPAIEIECVVGQRLARKSNATINVTARIAGPKCKGVLEFRNSVVVGASLHDRAAKSAF
jgi:hypothetical protein